ncbi:MAG: hypothetical protein GF419_03690 [Ignavibacteriales bacterium]|nr:hypothetical protein [Ignavibacteriales bacterium]
MKRLLFNVAALMLLTAAVGFAQQRMVDVEIGVMRVSDGEVDRLKANDEVNVGDQLRVIVEPSSEYYVYVVYSDHATSMLLNSESSQRKVTGGKKLQLPSANEFYVLDDKSSTANISVIVSEEKVDDVENIFKSKDEVAKFDWSLAEMKLDKKSKANVFNKTDKAVNMGGNVRATNTQTIELQRFTGMGVVMRKYNLDVLK